MDNKKVYLPKLYHNDKKIERYIGALQNLKEKLKQNEKYHEILKSFDSTNDSKLITNFFFFQNFKNYIHVDVINKDDNKEIFNNFYFLKENNGNKDIYNIIIHWIYFLYMELINNIYYMDLKISSKEINQINFLLEQTLNIIIKLYNKSGYIFSTKDIFDILYFLLFLIENNFNINYNLNNFDKLYNIKNYILLKILFSIFGNVSCVILNKANINAKKEEDMEYIDENYKNEISLFFQFLKDMEESKEMNFRLNKSIIFNNDLLINLFEKKIFAKINVKVMEKYESNFKNKLINFYANFTKFNFTESKFFSRILESLKYSFMNLNNFNENKEVIYKDIFIQRFYVKLLKTLLFYEDTSNINKTIKLSLFDSFFFNSYDSQIDLSIKNTNKFLENFSIFFSINLLPRETTGKTQKIYPIFIIKNNKKEILLDLSLKNKEKENEYEFSLIFNKKEQEIKQNKLITGFTYYIYIIFIQNKMFFSYSNGKSMNSSDIKIDKNTLYSENYNLIFGKNENLSFSGYIGPIIIIKNLSNIKDDEIRNFIKYIIKLDIYYLYFIFLKKDSNYFFENLNLFRYNNVLTNSKEKFEKFNFECLLYLTPAILNSKKIKEGTNKKFYLPNIDDICLMQKNYEIKALNITLVKHGNSNNNFISEDGINYICLLYEYLYQFLRHSEENKIAISKELHKIIVSIVRKTLFIIFKNFIDLDIFNLNKILKQLFMNIIQCLKMLSKIYYVMDDVLEVFFNIAVIYKNSIMDILDKKKNNIKRIFNKDIDTLLQINSYFLNGFIDFLLTHELYDFTNQNTLIKLFDNLTTYFEFGSLKEASILIKSHFFYKLLGFAPKLIDYFEKEEGKEKIGKNYTKKNQITDNYFLILKKFFENNSSKSDNINNLKYVFNFIKDNWNVNYEVCLVYFKFLYELIGDNPDLYFSDEINLEQIKMLFSFIYKFSENYEDNKLIHEIILNNRRKILNEIISIIMKILFTKKRINKNPYIIEEFKNLLVNTEITNDLISTITEEIKNLIIKSIGAKKNKVEKNEITEKKDYNKDNDDCNYLNNFYSEIFDLLLFFLEHPFNNSNIDNIKDLNTYEENVFDSIQIIGREVEGNKDNNTFTQDSVYCLIYLLKFYNNILFKRLYPEKYIKEFIKMCELCFKTSLIYSNILINLDDCYKTILEIILDICLNYIILSSKHFDEPLSFELLNGLRNDDIKREQEIIYKFLTELFGKNENKKGINTIFYKCDNLNFLIQKAEKEKKKARKESSIENNREFQKYDIIYNFLLKETNKFYLNFTTFFIIKLSGYNKLLININVKFGERNSEVKDFLKYQDIMKLLSELTDKLYEENELLYKNKDYVKFKKKYSSESEYYEEVKKRIVVGIKKGNAYNQVKDYIYKNIFENIEENLDLFNNINSGNFIKIDNKNSSNKNKEKKYSRNSNNLQLNNEIEDKQEHIISPKIKSSIEENSKSYDDEESSSLTSTGKEEVVLHFEEESPSSGTNDKKNEIDFTPQSSKTVNVRTAVKRKTVNNEDKKIYKTIALNSPMNLISNDIKDRKLSDNIHFYSKKLDKTYLFNEDKDEEEIPFINFFELPDIWFLKNSKKELMMNIFSVYFADDFFDNKSFKIMKKIYLQTTKGVNTVTKLLNFPSKIKSYSNGLEPFLFLKPFPTIFTDKLSFIKYGYFCNYMKENKEKILKEQIILYKKIYPIFNIENKFEQKCELIKTNKNYYGHIIGSELHNFFAFEELKYEFYEEENVKNNKQDLNDLFTLSVLSKQPKSKTQIRRMNEIEKNMIFPFGIKEKKVVIIIFEEIEEIIEKRFLLMWQAIEIYLKNGKSYFFNFINHENCQKILDFFKNNSITKDKIHERDYAKKEKLLRDEWVEGRFNTYEYLLFLNKYGSRTFNDSNQYYVFPWLKKVNDEAKIDKRDLRYPMAAQTERNKDISMKRYLDNEDGRNSDFPNHFGTHYSTSAYIYFYLMRVEPFTTLMIKLQGYKQEVAERMFTNIDELLYIFNNGRDNREVIPEFFNNIEIFLNLNCINFGMKKNLERIDDFFLCNKINKDDDNFDRFKHNSHVSDYVKFVIDNKNSLNSKKTSIEINKWIDIIFGAEQLPSSKKDKKNSYNIFYYESYEQNLDMFKKMKKLIKKGKETKKIISKILADINLITSFGQIPYKIFDDNHPKYGKKEKKNEVGFESDLNDLLWNKELKLKIELNPLFFVVNSKTGKIFIIDKERRLEIVECTLYAQKKEEEYKFEKYGQLKLPYIKFHQKIKINKEEQDNNNNKNNNFYYYKIKEKYCLSSFEENIDLELNDNLVTSKDLMENGIETIYNDNDNNDFNLYFNKHIKCLEYEEMKKEKKKKKKKEEETVKFITCRHLDNSFKVYNVTKSILKKDYKPMSYICEDFVSSCCTISYNKFIVGLKNGKLLQFTIEKEEELNKSKKDSNIRIKFNKEIKAHKGEINMIEIDKRLGVIMTAGSDNFLYIRKIYDFELLIPIKLKEKYIITLAKISPLNLLYILCFNKKKRQSCIRGYTLNGVFFAKSNYEFYDTLDFTKNGNIITFVNKSRIKILSSYSLKERHKYITTDKKKLKEFNTKINKLQGSSWIKFDFFSEKNYLEANTKIITYTNMEGNYNSIKTLDLSNFSYFD